MSDEQDNIDFEKILSKVQKLLRLGDSPNQEEASSAIAKAHELLTSYNLTMEDVGRHGKDEEVIEEDFMSAGRVKSWKKILFSAVCNYNFTGSYTHTHRTRDGYGYVTSSTVTYKLVGKPRNIIVTKAMIDYLFDAVDRLASGPGITGRGKSFIESYRLGLAEGLAIRLNKLRLRDKINTETTALVVQTDAEIQAFLDGKNLKEEKPIETSRSDAEAWHLGRQDAHQIPLNEQLDSTATSKVAISK